MLIGTCPKLNFCSVAGRAQAEVPEDAFTTGQVCPLPPEYMESRWEQLRIQGSNIRKLGEGRRGLKTYLTTWKNYDTWHFHRHGRAAPRCPWSGYIWLDLDQAVLFCSYMAKCNMTSAQVGPLPPATTSPLPPRYHPATIPLPSHYHLLAT
jgi:hypothetical protein